MRTRNDWFNYNTFKLRKPWCILVKIGQRYFRLVSHTKQLCLHGSSFNGKVEDVSSIQNAFWCRTNQRWFRKPLEKYYCQVKIVLCGLSSRSFQFAGIHLQLNFITRNILPGDYLEHHRPLSSFMPEEGTIAENHSISLLLHGNGVLWWYYSCPNRVRSPTNRE